MRDLSLVLVDVLDVVRIKQMHDGLSGNGLFEDIAVFEVALHQRLVVGLWTERTWQAATQHIIFNAVIIHYA